MSYENKNLLFNKMENIEKNKITIDVSVNFIETQILAEKIYYIFVYNITIINNGSVPAKLLSRYWLITDSENKIQEVNGTGVIGIQPYIKPKESFSYSSSAAINTPVGTMQGSYTMLSDDGDEFIALIPRFTLSIPRTLH